MEDAGADGNVDESDLLSLNLYEDVTAQEVEDFFKRVEADAIKESLPEVTEKEDEEDDDDGSGEPRWLKLHPVDDWTEASTTETHAEYIESLPEDSDRPIADLEDVCVQLVQYLIGHPSGLVTKRRKFPSKGGKSRYFGEEKSEDVMADKFETGCWACGKLTHDSGDCIFKRCFVCSEQGHQHWECTKKKLWCKNCSSKGHEQEDCPKIIYDEGIQKKEEDNDDYTDTFFCRCLSCREDGHINCVPAPKAVLKAPAPAPLRAPPGSAGKGPRPPARPPWQQTAAIRPALPSPTGVHAGWRPRPPAAPPGVIRPVAKWPAPSQPQPSSASNLDQSAGGGWKRPIAKWPAESPQKRPRLGGSEENWSGRGSQAPQQSGNWRNGGQNNSDWNRGKGGPQNNGWGNSQGNGWNGGWGNTQGRAQSWSGSKTQGSAWGTGNAPIGGCAKGGGRGANQGGGWKSRW